jgi:hypothetical protein
MRWGTVASDLLLFLAAATAAAEVHHSWSIQGTGCGAPEGAQVPQQVRSYKFYASEAFSSVRKLEKDEDRSERA